MDGNLDIKQLFTFIESLKVGQGRYAGQNFKLLTYERKFIKNALQPDVSSAVLSVARGNGKSTVAGALGAAAVKGPLMQPNAQVVVVAATFRQACITHGHICHFLKPWVDKNKPRYRVWSSANHAEVKDKETGAAVICVGNTPRHLSGLAPHLVLADELASWNLNDIAKSLAILDTSLGKLENSKILYLGTRASTPEHPFESLINGGADYVQVYSAGESDPPFQRRTWKKSNPGLDHFPDLEKKMRKEAERAKKDKGELAKFRAYRLNQGVSEVTERYLLEAGTWERIEVDFIDKTPPYILGLDLGSSVSMSAAAAYFTKSGYLDGIGQFPVKPGLSERGLADGVGNAYNKFYESGDLLIAGELVCDIGALIKECQKRWGTPECILTDSWKLDELKQRLGEIGYPNVPVVQRRQGFHTQSKDVRAFQIACLDGRVKPRKSLMLRSAMATARVAVDSAGNQKIEKKSMRMRDDLAVALVMAVGQGEQTRQTTTEQPAFHIIRARR